MASVDGFALNGREITEDGTPVDAGTVALVRQFRVTMADAGLVDVSPLASIGDEDDGSDNGETEASPPFREPIVTAAETWGMPRPAPDVPDLDSAPAATAFGEAGDPTRDDTALVAAMLAFALSLPGAPSPKRPTDPTHVVRPYSSYDGQA